MSNNLFDKPGSKAYEAAKHTLRTKYPLLNCIHPITGGLWGEATGRLVDVLQTPPTPWWGYVQPDDGHSDSFPQAMYDVLIKAQDFVDITSLSPPDGDFEKKINEAFIKLHETGLRIKIRCLFGNIIGMPVDTVATTKALTKDIPTNTKLRITVGSWRKNLTWNHSKIIAVDNCYLLEGGHNLWTDHYLKSDPVHDISQYLEGDVAQNAHRFVNHMWDWTYRTEKCSCCFAWMPDWIPCFLPLETNITYFPNMKGMGAKPPTYIAPPTARTEAGATALGNALAFANQAGDGVVCTANMPTPQMSQCKMITMGRYGAMQAFHSNPSDDAICSLFAAAKDTIYLSLQDLGPITLPMFAAPTSIPGGVWTKAYLRELGLAVARDVDVYLILSNPHAVPGPCSPLTANYGNGWTATDCAAEIVKALKANESEISKDLNAPGALRDMIQRNLHVAFIKNKDGVEKFQDDHTIGNHAKFFIIDEDCYYMGSQNLYIADLAEWGVLIDCPNAVKKIKKEYWNPMWEQSKFSKVNVDAILDGMNIDRNGESVKHASDEVKADMIKAQLRVMKCNGHNQGGGSNTRKVNTRGYAMLAGVNKSHVNTAFASHA